MIVPFNTLPQNARVWIYQSNREFSDKEVIQLSERVEEFLTTWKRHGEDLRASYVIKHNQFIVLSVDKDLNDVSGCSIDSSVHFIQQLEQEFDVDLMNKMSTAFKIGDNINVVSLAQFQQFVKDGKIITDTIVFNNMVLSKGDFDTTWEVPASQSWHNRFFGKVIS